MVKVGTYGRVSSEQQATEGVFFLLEDGEHIIRVEYGQPDRGEAWVH